MSLLVVSISEMLALSGESVEQIVRHDGNLTPPVSIYNTTVASSIATISSLPLGLVAIVINFMLIYSIKRSGEYQPATYKIYLHIAFCDLLNGLVGVVTASFMLQNMRSPIDPEVADKFCEYFAPLPTCVINLLLYLMTLMAFLRVLILCFPQLRMSTFHVNFIIFLLYLLAASFRLWYAYTTVKTMALPDGWCIYYTEPNNFTPDDQYYYALADAVPVITCSFCIMICLVVVGCKVRKVSRPQTASYDYNSVNESTPFFIQRRVVNEQLSVARSIVNNILVTFLVCYSAAFYIECRHLLHALNLVNYEYVSFDDPDGPPAFDNTSLLIFRLKFSLTIFFSIINPVLVFRGSAIFRNNIGGLFEVDDFSYVVSAQ
ncbi:hypothetical protein ACHWQZ_G003753 [Mnemiopsis leidyi]